MSWFKWITCVILVLSSHTHSWRGNSLRQFCTVVHCFEISLQLLVSGVYNVNSKSLSKLETSESCIPFLVIWCTYTYIKSSEESCPIAIYLCLTNKKLNGEECFFSHIPVNKQMSTTCPYSSDLFYMITTSLLSGFVGTFFRNIYFCTVLAYEPSYKVEF